jgi:hypothetical protein
MGGVRYVTIPVRVAIESRTNYAARRSTAILWEGESEMEYLAIRFIVRQPTESISPALMAISQKASNFIWRHSAHLNRLSSPSVHISARHSRQVTLASFRCVPLDRSGAFPPEGFAGGPSPNAKNPYSKSQAAQRGASTKTLSVLKLGP